MTSSSSSTISTPLLTIDRSSFIPYTFNTPINRKLNEDNYLIWQQQVLATGPQSYALPGWFLCASTLLHMLLQRYGCCKQYNFSRFSQSWTAGSPASCLAAGFNDHAYPHQDGGPSYVFSDKGSAEHLLCHSNTCQSKKTQNPTPTNQKRQIWLVGSPITPDDHIEAILDGLSDWQFCHISDLKNRSSQYSRYWSPSISPRRKIWQTPPPRTTDSASKCCFHLE